MKKFTLLLMAALMVVASGVAQSKGKVQTAKKVERTVRVKAPERPVLKLTETIDMASAKNRQLPLAAGRKLTRGAKAAGLSKTSAQRRVAVNKVQRRAAGVIIDQPAGTYHNMVYASSYYGYSWFAGGLYNGTYSDALGEVVEGTDGNLYIHNLLTELYTEEGYWVKAEKVEGEADTYVIHKQPIYVEEYGGTLSTYYIQKATLDQVQSTMVPAANSDIKVTWKNGVLRTATEFNSATSLRATISAFDGDGGWTGAMNWNITMSPQTDVAITELPAGVEPQEMVMKYIGNYEEQYSEENDETTKVPVWEAQKVKVAVSGNDIYLQFFTGIDSWIKGTIEGDKATFAAYQYLGPSREYNQHAYFLAADAAGRLVDQVTFNYDATTHGLSNSGLQLYANAGKSKIYYIRLYGDPEIYKFVEKVATPPAIDDLSMYGSNWDPQSGYAYLDFTIPYFDEDGYYMDPDKLFYKFYFGDDETNTVFTFTPEEYAGLTENTTEVPSNYSDNDFWVSGANREVVFYVNMSKNLGVQLVYKGGGEERASAITWYYNNNGAAGYESVFPEVENPTVHSTLNTGEQALNLGEVAYSFGSGRAVTESYDVAMKIEDNWAVTAKLSGKKVVGVSVPFISIEGISNARVWLSTTIDLDENGKFTPNGPVKEFTLSDNGYTTVRFDQPYEIPEGGLFIGYSFTQAFPEGAKPIALTGTTNVGGFMVHSDKVYRIGWASMEGKEGDLGLEAILTGGDDNAALITNVKEVYLTANTAAKTAATVANYGCTDLQSISYKYSMLGYDVKNDKELTLRGEGNLTDIQLPRVFGGYKTFNVDIPAAESTADYVYYASATKANGNTNACYDAEGDDQAQCNVFVLNFVPKKRPLMEEYTGTWCGYCPRGYVGLEKMAELYPEDFIALSYHNADPMEVTEEFPSDVQGFPAAYLDRKMKVDAYYGLEQDGFGIDKAWLQRCQEFGVADIDVEASWSEDLKTINVKSTTKFARSEEGANYAICYAVVADGLKGTGDGWEQSNYYAGEAPMTYMDRFTSGESYVSGLTFNDVFVGSTPYEGVANSLPVNITEGETYTHECQLSAAAMLNTSGQPVIQDKSKVKVVAILVDVFGTVYNANRCQVITPAAISELTGDASRIVKTEYYDMAGRKVLVPEGGIYVKTVRYQNGTTATEKVMVK